MWMLAVSYAKIGTQIYENIRNPMTSEGKMYFCSTNHNH